MQLIILILVAGVAGYLLAKSRLSKPIDDTGEKVTQTTRDLADKTEGWVKSRFGRKQKIENDQVDSGEEEVEVSEEAVEEKKTAEKRSSRRKTESSDEAVVVEDEVEP